MITLALFILRLFSKDRTEIEELESRRTRLLSLDDYSTPATIENQFWICQLFSANARHRLRFPYLLLFHSFPTCQPSTLIAYHKETTLMEQ